MTGPPYSAELLEWARGQEDWVVALLESLARCESPSSDPSSQLAVRALLAEAFEPLNYRVRQIPGRTSGGMLYASPRRRRRGASAQLLLGHYDTVWPTGTLASMPFERDGNVVRGPGVFDMKGGLVMIILALRGLRELDVVAEVTPVVFVNSDEEIGSRDSRRYIEALARRVIRAFVLEPSLGEAGRLKTARKGIARFTVTVTGQAAHAGLEPGKGASAILELSHVIQRLFELNDPGRGVTVNVGTIDGGLRPNVVAPESRAVVDVRVAGAEDARRVESAIRSLEARTPGTELRIEGGFGRPPLEATPRNQRLWERARELGTVLGLDLEQAAVGGGSDGNTTSLYTATLDGLGPVGGGAHAPDEHLRLEPTLQRAALLALLLADPAIAGSGP
jgi:glutamate carboxypeptidase